MIPLKKVAGESLFASAIMSMYLSWKEGAFQSRGIIDSSVLLIAIFVVSFFIFFSLGIFFRWVMLKMEK